MKQRSTIFGAALLIAGLIILPNLAGWLVRDFMHQTMQMACDFEKASVDPLKGNLTLKNLAIKKNGIDASNSHSKANSIDIVWAKYSLPQLLFRKFDTPLIVLSGVQIVECDSSATELPKFAMESKPHANDPSLKLENLPSATQQIASALKRSKLQSMLEAEKKGIEKELNVCNDELVRLKGLLNSLAASQFSQSNRLRSESEAKRIQAAIATTESLAKNLHSKLARDESKTQNAIVSAQRTALVDWMSWSDERKVAVQSIDANEVVTAVLSEYAKHLIQPMYAPLKTTHSFLKWSALEHQPAQKCDAGSSDMAPGDFLAGKPNSLPFDYKTIKLRGKSLIAPDPYVISGTITKASRSKGFDNYSRPISMEMRFDGPDSSPTTPAKTSSPSISSRATFDPNLQKQNIFIQFIASEPVAIGSLSVDPFDPNIHATILASKPRALLSWSIQGDRWTCNFDFFASEVIANLNAGNESAPEQIWKKTFSEELSVKHVSPPSLLSLSSDTPRKLSLASQSVETKPVHDASQRGNSDFAVFSMRFNGKLADGCFDNCNESVQSVFAQEMAAAFKEFFNRKTEADLLAEKQIWVRESDQLISGLQSFQKSANQQIRQNLDSMGVEIRKEQERLAQALSDPSDLRFSRKTLDEPSTNLRR